MSQTTYALAKQLPEIHARGLVAQTAYGDLVLEPHEVKAVAKPIEKALLKRLDPKRRMFL
jgi:hypothetical protein